MPVSPPMDLYQGIMSSVFEHTYYNPNNYPHTESLCDSISIKCIILHSGPKEQEDICIHQQKEEEEFLPRLSGNGT